MFRVLRTSDLIKIPIHVTFVAGGYMLRVGPYRLDLIPEEVNGTDALRLYVDRNPTPKIFLISAVKIRGKLQRGGYVPWDRSHRYYVVGNGGQRFKFLYVHPKSYNIGTCVDFGARFPYNVLSKGQRRRYRRYNYSEAFFRKI
jgi:hypothetical protein